MHGISEPVRKDEQEQVGDGERLGLEVVNLRQGTSGSMLDRRGGNARAKKTHAPKAEKPRPRKNVRNVRAGSSGSSWVYNS